MAAPSLFRLQGRSSSILVDGTPATTLTHWVTRCSLVKPFWRRWTGWLTALSSVSFQVILKGRSTSSSSRGHQMATNCGQIKTGSLSRVRLAEHNQLLRPEHRAAAHQERGLHSQRAWTRIAGGGSNTAGCTSRFCSRSGSGDTRKPRHKGVHAVRRSPEPARDAPRPPAFRAVVLSPETETRCPLPVGNGRGWPPMPF